MCGRWECHAFGHARWSGHYLHFLGVMHNLLNNVANVIPHCAKVVYIVTPCDKDVIMFNILFMPPVTPTQPQGYWPLVMDLTTCYWTYTSPDSAVICLLVIIPC